MSALRKGTTDWTLLFDGSPESRYRMMSFGVGRQENRCRDGEALAPQVVMAKGGGSDSLLPPPSGRIKFWERRSFFMAFTPRPGTFLPFGGGGRLCPGKDLAKLEIAIFLHHFLLNYSLERVDPKGPTQYLPHTRPKDNCLARIRKLSSPSTA
ncbi:hypothetical protein MLD38_032408 [Melastoma candidum]|uniref:Uncharacterized protein n=1 Tax=Melastoma candidum TaxID=119954 RepID=A0ACB9M462_9MYRT|nr:hypothetical protein MLD38_032408 [Melastoma candidum]